MDAIDLVEGLASTGMFAKGVGDDIVMPEPIEGDAWTFGNFNAVIIDENEVEFLVEDQDSDVWCIQKERINHV